MKDIKLIRLEPFTDEDEFGNNRVYLYLKYEYKKCCFLNSNDGISWNHSIWHEVVRRGAIFVCSREPAVCGLQYARYDISSVRREGNEEIHKYNQFFVF